MLSEKVIEQLTERLVARIEEGNTYVLKKIGESIKQIGTLNPSSVQRLAQTMKYGGSYNQIVNKLAEITRLNIADIYKIFDELAKHDYQFARKFYKYRGVDYIPYEKNIALKRQVRALAKMTAESYANLSKTTVIGFKTTDMKKKTVFFKGLGQTYRDTIDKAVLSVEQGKTSFNEAMRNTLKELGHSGLNTVDYESGHSRRLDSAVRMNIQGALRELHNITQEIFGEQFGADGVEISVHSNPADDHQEAQGRQFSDKEYKKLQETGKATTFDGKVIDLYLKKKNGEDMASFRPISLHNCYHYTFAIVLGVSQPEFSDEKLQEIIDRNKKGFDFDNRHYSMYEGTQLQRKLETEIRRQKDTQILAKASGNNELVLDSQDKISKLNTKYNQLCQASGLPRKIERLRVDGYKKV